MGRAAPDACRQMRAVAAALFGADVAVAVRDPRGPQPTLLPGEDGHLARATAARRREFAAGRTAVRQAMAQLGGAAVAIPQGPDRAPLWPAGWQGSLSHSDRLCVAVVTRAPRTLGVDIEPDQAMPEDMQTTICSERELDRIEGPQRGHLATLVFSAKEAVYKAQFGQSGLLFGFDHIDVRLDPAAHRFTATFIKPANPFAPGDTLQGRFGRAAGHLVTAVAIGQGAGKGA